MTAVCRGAYHELVTAVPALLAVTSNPFGLPVSSDVAPMLQLLADDYPHIRFWKSASFNPKADGVSNTGGSNARGGTLASQGINVSARYIEMENGQIVDGYRVTAIHKTAQQIWFGLLSSGMAPPVWGQATLQAVSLYNKEMCRQFPELRYCADNWKAGRIATNNYSSWHSTHGPTTHDGKRKKAPSKPRTEPPPIEARKKIKLDDPDLFVRGLVSSMSFTYSLAPPYIRLYILCEPLPFSLFDFLPHLAQLDSSRTRSRDHT